MLGGQYIAVGVTMRPAVHLLSGGAIALLSDRLSLNREQALALTFGTGCDYAFQVNELMLSYLLEQATADGIPFAAELVQIASAIARGKPIGEGKDYSEGSGGSKIPRSPKAPKGGGNGGARFEAQALAIEAQQS